MISPQAETVEVRKLSSGSLEIERIAADGQVEPSQFPGITIEILGIWPSAD